MRVGHVGIAAGTGGQVVSGGSRRRPPVEAAQRRLGVDHLDGVDQAFVDAARRAPVSVRLRRIGSYGMRHVHDRRPARGSPCAASAGCGADGDALVEEQPDDLAGVGAQLLADDHPAREAAGQFDGALDRVVVGDAEHIDAGLGHCCGELVGRRGRVAAPHRVAVHVDTHPTRWQRLAEMWVASHSSGEAGRARVATVQA